VEARMITADNIIMLVTTLLLLFVDWLAFHDYLEPHTVRDWLMLVASLLVFLQFGRIIWRRSTRTG
jgi:O-antigen ligase